jgi:hypothetical protein
MLGIAFLISLSLIIFPIPKVEKKIDLEIIPTEELQNIVNEEGQEGFINQEKI